MARCMAPSCIDAEGRLTYLETENADITRERGYALAELEAIHIVARKRMRELGDAEEQLASIGAKNTKMLQDIAKLTQDLDASQKHSKLIEKDLREEKERTVQKQREINRLTAAKKAREESIEELEDVNVAQASQIAKLQQLNDKQADELARLLKKPDVPTQK